MTRTALVAFGLAIALATSAAAQSLTTPIPFDDATPRNTRFGQLDYLGGLEWRAERPDFGGLSGMVLDGDMLTAITDKGHWARTRMVFNGKGGLAALKGLEVWRLYGADGEFLQRPKTDSEAITMDGDALLIAFERDHRVSRFDGLRGREQPLDTLPDLSGLGFNQGIEALLKLPDGRLLMIAEEPPEGRDHVGWIDGARFTITRRGSYSPTDVALGPEERWVYLLERRFSILGGPGMRIRRFPLADLKAGAEIDGETLIDLGAGYAVDNMEGIATRRGKGGSTELFVLSDDNFSSLQRTLLLHFRVR